MQRPSYGALSFWRLPVGHSRPMIESAKEEEAKNGITGHFARDCHGRRCMATMSIRLGFWQGE